jgi:hypothetical protein
VITPLLRQVDTARVLAASAALQMDRDNLNELLVLQKLSRLAATHATPQGKDLSSSAIKRLLSADEVGGPDVLSQLDPFEGFPVVEVLVPPHRFLVLEGLATDSAEIAARALRAVFAVHEIKFPARYLVEVSSVANFLLGLSDVLSRRFGRTVNDRAPTLTRKVTIPSGARLAELAQRVVFSREELFVGMVPSEAQFLAQSLMWRHGEMTLVSSSAPAGAQDEMPGTANEATPDDVFASMMSAADDDSCLIVRPLVETHLGIVVASPTCLAATLRHFIVVGAQRHDCVSQLVAALTHSAVSDLKFLLETTTEAPLRFVPARPPQDVDTPGRGGQVPEMGDPDAHTGEQRDVTTDDHADAHPDVDSGAFPDPSWHQGVVRLTAPFDGDKMLDVRLTVDTLDAYDPTTVWGHATKTPIDVTPLPHPADRVLVLETHLGIGRDHLYLGGAEHSPGLFASISDVSTILYAPGSDRLTLWYFANALRRLHESTRVFSFSVVDTFAIYRDAHDSFYLSDDAAPQFMNVTVGSGQELRDEAARAAGSPFALYGNGISRALACHGDASPVSVILADPSVCFARLGKLTAWARCRIQPESTASGPDIHPHGTPELQLPESITYWLWQLHLTEPSLLFTPPGVSELQVETRIARPHYDADDHHESGTGGNWVAHDPSATDVDPIVRGAGTIGFTLVGQIPGSPPETGPPNHVDRQLIKALIDGLVSINPRPEDWPPGRRAALVDVVAPAGYKAMTQIVRADDSLMLWPGTLPPAMRVNDATTAQILDHLGEHLAAAGFRRGPIPNEDRTNFLNEHVTGYFIGWLEREVPELDATTALPRLVAMYEALLHESAAEAERLPTRIACFGEHASDVKHIQRHRQSGTISSIALRFLIEYVAAHAPRGSATLTNEKYDLLLAIASEVVNKGMLSDTLRRRLAGHQISILASGRLGISREQEAYTKAVTSFSEDLTTRTVRQASELARSVRDTTQDGHVNRAAGGLTSGDRTEPGAPLQDLDVLATAEYGFSYSQLVAVCGGLIDASRESGQEDVGSLDEPTVRRVISESTGMNDANAQVMLDALTLVPVEDYWAAGTDAYPWRFNRDRSYLRRPLVAMPSASSDATELLFGHRNVWLTPRHWLERHLTGRLRAKSREMKQALAAQRDAKGADFETEVEHTARGANIQTVVRRFKKVGSLNLGNVDGEDLGDVDVLLVSPHGTIVAIEAKALETGRTPGELANEVDSLTTGPKAATVRIQSRVAVLTRHLREVEQVLGLAHDPRRRVVPLVVTDAPLLGNYLSTSDVTIAALDELVDTITSIDTARRRR